MPATTTRRTRRYDSSRRKQQASDTRAAIVAAAGRLFAERGWTGTSIRDVAREAGVAVETIYATIGPKPDLLQSVADAAVVGDLEPIPLAERPEFQGIKRGATVRDRARVAARFVVGVQERTWRVALALREGAAADGDLNKRLRENEERRRISVAEGAAMVAGRPVSDAERDALWAVLSVDVYQMLVEFSSWTPAQYEDWVTDEFVSILSKRRSGRS